ncbi:HET-domain-containing protein, partial [Lophium mytilinum]
MRRWIRTCVQNHEVCRETLSGALVDETAPPVLPTRILEIGPDDSRDPRLIETHGSTGYYAALSHCWGPPHKRPIMTTSENYEERKAGIPWNTIPKAYQHAIIAAREISLTYIWIDSLCIVQNNREDWLRESTKMGDVYESARLTIAASHASDSSQGCFYERPELPEAVELSIAYRSRDGELSGSVFATAMHSDYADISPEFGVLASRAWATQEWLLSRRMIFYTRGCIVWSCKVITQRETGGSFHTTARNPKWKFIVEKYSARFLTNAGDRLIALEGLRREIQKRTKDTYWFGIWKNATPDQLLWYSVEPADRLLSPLEIPTWSWAS